MYLRELTVNFGPCESSDRVFASARDSKTDTWVGVAYGDTESDAFSHLVNSIVSAIDEPQSHYWR